MQNFRKSFIALSILLMALNACHNDNGSGLPAYTNPIMENDSFFIGARWNDPHVLYTNDQFIMYASSDNAWDGYVKIFRLTSPNGANWTLDPSTPVLTNSAGQWDSQCVETPAVVYFQGNYHLFYTGYDVPYDYSDVGDDGTAGTDDDDSAAKHFKIGHAVSPDGITFTKVSNVVESTAPYAAVNSDFDQYIVGEPAPVVFSNKIYLYFTAVGAAAEVGTTWQTIGLVTYDGSDWDTPRRVLTPDLTLYPRTSGDQYIGYSTPNAVIINNKVHLYCDVALNDPWTQVKLHHASSADGETGWTQDPASLYSRDDFTWTAAEIRSPSALVHNDRLYLYFAGHVLSPAINLGIGLEIIDLPE